MEAKVIVEAREMFPYPDATESAKRLNQLRRNF
jgi:hypothetical protein